MNSLKLCGAVQEEPVIHHKKFDINFWLIKIKVERQSGIGDIIDIIISEKLYFNHAHKGDTISVEGEIRNNKIFEHGKTVYMLYVYAESIIKLDNNIDLAINNEANITGSIYKKSELRYTDSGRKLVVLTVAIDGRYRKYHIPVLCWGPNAVLAEHLELNTELDISGRLQSRKNKSKIIHEISAGDIVLTKFKEGE